MRALGVTRWVIRLMLLAAAVFLMLGGPLPAALDASITDAARRLLPGLSPLMAVSETLSQRTWYLGIFWWGPPAVVLAMAIWRGRWFCRWIARSTYRLDGTRA